MDSLDVDDSSKNRSGLQCPQDSVDGADLVVSFHLEDSESFQIGLGLSVGGASAKVSAAVSRRSENEIVSAALAAILWDERYHPIPNIVKNKDPDVRARALTALRDDGTHDDPRIQDCAGVL